MSDNTTRKTSRWGLYIPFILFALIAIAWFFYWNFAKGIMEDELAKWIDDQRARGATVEYEDLNVRGFPFFLRAEIDEPYIDQPGDYEWSAQGLMVDTLPYNPTSLTFTPVGQQTLTAKIDNEMQSWTGSAETIRFRLAENEIGLLVDGLDASNVDHANESLTINDLRFNLEIRQPPEAAEDAPKNMAALALAGYGWRYQESGNRVIALDVAEIAAAVTEYTAYEQTGSLRVWANRDGKLVIDHARMMFTADSDPKPSIVLNGEMTVDDAAYPEGQVAVALTDPGPLVDLLVGWGVIEEQEASVARQTLVTMANASGGTLNAPLSFSNGKLKVSGFSVADLEPLE